MTSPSHDDAARRAYWTEQMEAGYALVPKIVAFDVDECGEGFASIREAADTAGVEVMFSDTKIAGELERVYFIRQGLVRDVVAIAQDMNDRGWILKIEDGYRSLEMQRQLVCKQDVFDAILRKCIWENDGALPTTEQMFQRAIVMIANIPKIGTHMSGSAIDISVYRRDDGTEVCRGKPYLEVSELTPMLSPFVDAQAHQNRLDITQMMEAHGFVHFPFEFWHYNKNDGLGHILSGKPAPAKYGPVDWDPATNRVTPCQNPTDPLNPLDVIEREIAAALERFAD